MFPLLLAALLALPGVARTALGAGLVGLAVVVGVVLVVVGRAKKSGDGGSDDRLARLLDQVSPNLVVVLLALIGGCVQLAGDDGLYWIAASSVLSLVGGVVNAWLFMTRS